MITYVDTSALVKLLVADEPGADEVEQLWLASTSVVCCDLGYVEVRAALAAAHRALRLTSTGLRQAKADLEGLWNQLTTVPVTAGVILHAADLAEDDGVRGYDAVHLAAALVVPVDTFAASDGRLSLAASAHGLLVLQQ